MVVPEKDAPGAVEAVSALVRAMAETNTVAGMWGCRFVEGGGGRVGAARCAADFHLTLSQRVASRNFKRMSQLAHSVPQAAINARFQRTVGSLHLLVMSTISSLFHTHTMTRSGSLCVSSQQPAAAARVVPLAV